MGNRFPTVFVSLGLPWWLRGKWPVMWETWVQSLGWEDALEKEMATHSSILAWKIPGTEEPGGLQSTGLQGVGHDWVSLTKNAVLEGIMSLIFDHLPLVSVQVDKVHFCNRKMTSSPRLNNFPLSINKSIYNSILFLYIETNVNYK